MDQRLSLRIDNGIADVRLTRPDKMNALDPLMFDAIEACGAELVANPAVRAVVLSGEGRAFCAGLDFATFESMTGDGTPIATFVPRADGITNQAQHIVKLWRALPVPVIAAVHGIAFGGGCQLMLGADIRIIAPDTRLSIMEVQWGLVPDMAGIALMRSLVRDDIARELTFTGREFSGEDAVRYGLATRAAGDPLTEARRLAAIIAGLSPDAVRGGKQLLNRAADANEVELLQAEAAMQATLLASPNQIEAVQARLARRRPVFTDPDAV